MHPTLEQPNIEPNTIQQWTEASTSLVTAISRFCDLSTLLETKCTFRSEGSSDLIALLDLSLNYLLSPVDSRLAQARVSLAKTRNRLTRSIFSLPQEILCEIFRNVIYSPKDEDDPSAVATHMSYRVETIYRRLYSLLNVCTAWWRTGIACRDLWSVIPIVDPITGRRSRSTRLSLQRAPSKGLNLAVALRSDLSQRFKTLASHKSRFSSINISHYSGSSHVLMKLLSIFFEGSTPKFISRLSLNGAPDEKLLDMYLTGFEPQFYQLLESLSALHLGGFDLDWPRTTFSNRLAVLELGRISLGDQPRIEMFISALATANALQDLKLISIRGTPDEAWQTSMPFYETSILPHLESLHIEDMCINIFDIFMKVIQPGSYHLTLNIDNTFTTRHYVSDDIGSTEYNKADCDEFYASLRFAKVDKLIICMDEELGRLWHTPAGLRALLKSVPGLKTIILNFCSIDSDILKAFRKPPRPSSLGSSCNDLFPRLEVIEFHCATFVSPLDHLKKEFEDILASHSVRRMVLGVWFEEARAEKEIAENDPMIRWLKAKVPEFHLFPQDDAPELCSIWELWDV